MLNDFIINWFIMHGLRPIKINFLLMYFRKIKISIFELTI